MLDTSIYLGDKQVERNEDVMSHVPDAIDDKHTPLSFKTFSDAVCSALNDNDMPVECINHSVANDGQAYFAIATIKNTSVSDCTPVVAWQSNHDRRISATLYSGFADVNYDTVCLCDEYKLVSRPACDPDKSLPELVSDTMRQIHALTSRYNHLMRQMRIVDIVEESELNEILVSMLRQDIILHNHVHNVLDAWDNPTDTFNGWGQDENLWTLFHCVLHSYKIAMQNNKISTLTTHTPRLITFVKSVLMDNLGDI